MYNAWREELAALGLVVSVVCCNQATFVSMVSPLTGGLAQETSAAFLPQCVCILQSTGVAVS